MSANSAMSANNFLTVGATVGLESDTDDKGIKKIKKLIHELLVAEPEKLAFFDKGIKNIKAITQNTRAITLFT